jgi:hypothetical protein
MREFGSIRDRYMCNADITPSGKDIRNAYMNELYAIEVANIKGSNLMIKRRRETY